MKWHHRRPPREFFDQNDYLAYQDFTITELLSEERSIINQLRCTNDMYVKVYLKKDLETIQRVIKEKQPAGSYRAAK